MIRRAFATAFLVLFGILAFLGVVDPEAVVRIPFGLLFLLLAVLVWRKWEIITGNFSPGLFDGMTAHGADHYRSADDHYRRDGQSNYREPFER
jgi:hypothetical protein